MAAVMKSRIPLPVRVVARAPPVAQQKVPKPEPPVSAAPAKRGLTRERLERLATPKSVTPKFVAQRGAGKPTRSTVGPPVKKPAHNVRRAAKQPSSSAMRAPDAAKKSLRWAVNDDGSVKEDVVVLRKNQRPIDINYNGPLKSCLKPTS